MAALNAPPFARDNPKREVDQQQGEDAQQQPFLTPHAARKEHAVSSRRTRPVKEHAASKGKRPATLFNI
jgi:hypothetical protein